MSPSLFANPDALPQLIGEFRPADVWQAHINEIFYGLRGGQLREYYQTFASADYRLAHALAADYYEQVLKRDNARSKTLDASSPSPSPTAARLTVHEWGCGNGNLAACFLSHLKNLDTAGAVYPRVRYVLVDSQKSALEAALNHPDLAEHRDRVETLQADVTQLDAVPDGSVDRIFCNELWNDLAAKLMLRREGEIEEEFVRPNVSEAKYDAISDWSGFVRAFTDKDVPTLVAFQPFLDEIIWEKEYRKIEWKDVPYRRTITESLKQVDEHVLVPVNMGALATLKEAKRVLAADALGFSSFDAGTADMQVLNDPEKPCYGQYGGQFSFMINFALMEAIASHLGIRTIILESQREMVGRSLGTNVISLMDRDRVILKTFRTLAETYQSPYERKIDFPLSPETPPQERDAMREMLRALKPNGVPDTVAYLTEEEVFDVIGELERLGYDREIIKAALMAPPQGVEYTHFFCRS